jgi:hypothetical protein
MTAAQMNLSGFGPGDLNPVIQPLERAVTYRFGWRRAVPGPLLARRLKL